MLTRHFINKLSIKIITKLQHSFLQTMYFDNNYKF